ncbi:hypothetical protein EXN66_Car015484 [Channa argus]|uniref:Secreted protein n=1 Tax=Channa argus TaxID=215402 RepID=A0A6G1QBD6_CHAAH|nr:hypothetical protein EXN66_Car015484 [Channa argus]
MLESLYSLCVCLCLTSLVLHRWRITEFVHTGRDLCNRGLLLSDPIVAAVAHARSRHSLLK